MTADALQLPFEVDHGAVLVRPPVVIGFDQPEHFAPAQPEYEDQRPKRVRQVILIARAFEELRASSTVQESLRRFFLRALGSVSSSATLRETSSSRIA